MKSDILDHFCAILLWNCHHKCGAQLLRRYFWCSQSIEFRYIDSNSSLLQFSIHYLFMWVRIEYGCILFFRSFPYLHIPDAVINFFPSISFHSINILAFDWPLNHRIHRIGEKKDIFECETKSNWRANVLDSAIHYSKTEDWRLEKNDSINNNSIIFFPFDLISVAATLHTRWCGR